MRLLSVLSFVAAVVVVVWAVWGYLSGGDLLLHLILGATGLGLLPVGFSLGRYARDIEFERRFPKVESWRRYSEQFDDD